MELKNYDVNLIQEEKSFSKIHMKEDSKAVSTLALNIPKFKQKVIDYLKKFNDLIEGTADQKKFIWLKSIEILDDYISRAKNNEITIRKDANLKVIASSIIYTVIISSENMPRVSITKLSGLYISQVTNYYRKYFKQLYPRLEFSFGSYNFKKFRMIFSLYFFELLRNTETEASELVLQLLENIMKNINLPEQLTDNDINALRELVTYYEDMFIDYFSDLAEIVNQLIISSKVLKKIGAHLVIKYLTEFLEIKGVTLFQTSQNLARSIVEIFDFLKKKFPEFFPSRSYVQGRQKGYKKIVGSKIKLYILKNIYNGDYCEDGKIQCPDCKREGFEINTDISRLKAWNSHHSSEEKEYLFSARNLYKIYSKNRSNPNILEELITLMESEGIIFKCSNHHTILHDEYYRLFGYLISWERIFSLPPEIIHILIRISVENLKRTKNLSIDKKKEIRRYIRKKLRKRYVVELVHGTYCPACGEFNTKEHLTAFHFNHENKKRKSINASDLYDLPCSKIVQILEKERGGYLCSNCHSVIHYDKYIPLLDKIFKDNNVVNKILEDYERVSKKFTVISSIKLIRDPLKTSKKNYDSLERYLTVIHEISKSGLVVITSALADYLKISISPVHNFFRNWGVFIRRYVNIIVGQGSSQSRYILTDEGKEIISLIYHFKNYYKSL